MLRQMKRFVWFFFNINLFLFGCAGSYVQQVGSLVVACELLVVAYMWDLVP